LAGGALASLASLAMLHGLTTWRPPFGEFPIQFLVEPDATVFFFATLLTLCTGVLFGLIPARQIWQTDPNTTLRTSGSTNSTATRSTLRSSLLVIQVALCCLLVTASLVAFRGLQRTFTMPLGFQPQGVVKATFDVHLAGYGKDQRAAIQQRLLDAAAAIPGVTAAAYSNTVPLDLDHSTTSVYPPGTTEFNRATDKFGATYYEVSPNYFAVTGTKLLAGREFSAHDDTTHPDVAVVNQTFAKRLFGTQDVIGKRYPTGPGKETEVIGLVEDGKYQTLTEAPEPAVFLPILQSQESDTTLLVKSARDPQELVPALRRAIAEVDSGLPVFNVSTWNDALMIATFPARAATMALGVLGALAIMLAVTGIFGIANYAVSRNLREFGIRVALGAKSWHVVRAAVGGTLFLLGIGSLAGLLLGFAASKLLASIVYSASASDPVVIFAVAATMALLGFVSAALPARRALRADPAVLLRDQ
jgi:predicted permease